MKSRSAAAGGPGNNRGPRQVVAHTPINLVIRRDGRALACGRKAASSLAGTAWDIYLSSMSSLLRLVQNSL